MTVTSPVRFLCLRPVHMSCLDADFHRRCLDRLLSLRPVGTQSPCTLVTSILYYHTAPRKGSPQPTLTSVGHSTIRHTHIQATLGQYPYIISFVTPLPSRHYSSYLFLFCLFMDIIIPFAADWWTHFFLHPLFAREKICEKENEKKNETLVVIGSVLFGYILLAGYLRRDGLQYLGFTITTLSIHVLLRLQRIIRS